MDQVPCQMRVNLGICEVWLLISLLPDWKKNGSQYNYYLAIFISNSIVTGMPYLPAKDELVSLNRLSSKGFENGIIQRFLTGDYMAWNSISLFAGFFEKENSLETLIVIFENGFFSDWIWRISEFPFWRKILDIYIFACSVDDRYANFQ